MGITATIISLCSDAPPLPLSKKLGKGASYKGRGVFTQADNDQTEKMVIMVMYTIITRIKLLVVINGSESRTVLTKFK